MPDKHECSLLVRQKTYRGASVVIDGSKYEIEARTSMDGAPYDEDRDSLDCRITVDGFVEREGQAVWDLGKDVGESPADEPIRYLQQFLREWGEDVELLPPQTSKR